MLKANAKRYIMQPTPHVSALATCLLLFLAFPAAAQQVVPAPASPGALPGVLEDDPYLFHVYGTRPGEPVNIRSGAGTSFRIIGTLADGAPVEKLNCNEDSRGYWCRIATTDRPRLSGWVVGRALQEDGVPHAKAPSTDDYVAEGIYDAISPHRCRQSGNRPMENCN